MKLIIISPPDTISHEAETINALFDEGLQVYHLRKPGWSAMEMEFVVSRINPQHLDRVSLHNNHVHRTDWGIARLHFPEKERLKMPEELFEDFAKHSTLSTSVHSPEGLISLSKSFSYTFGGPMFPSISKPGYQSAVTWNKNSVTKQQGMKLIALGGIDENNIVDVISSGFGGAAVLGAIWQSENPVGKYKLLRSIVESHKMN